MKAYSRKLHIISKMMIIFCVLFFIYYLVINRQFYLGLLLLPSFIYVIHSTFCLYQINDQHLYILRWVPVPWTRIKTIKKLSPKLYVLRSEVFPWVIQIRESEKFEELIHFIEEKVISDNN